MKWFSMKWPAAVALTAVLGSSLTLVAWRAHPSPAEQAPVPEQAGVAPGAVEGIGYVEPASETRQLAPKTGGVVKACYVKAGDFVKKGDRIVTLHDEKEAVAVLLARKQLEVARAEEAQVKSGINSFKIVAAERTVAKYQADHQFAAREAERVRRVYASRGASQSDLEFADSKRAQLEASVREAEAELQNLQNFVRDVDKELARAKVAQAEANLELAQQQLRDLTVFAPIDGTVLKVLKHPGEGIRMIELDPVVIFGDLSRFHVRAEIDERFVKDLRVGQKAEVFGRNLPGKTYPGRVVEVEKIMGDRTVVAGVSPERKNLHVLQVVIEMEPGFSAPVGLQVDVRIKAEGP